MQPATLGNSRQPTDEDVEAVNNLRKSPVNNQRSGGQPEPDPKINFDGVSEADLKVRDLTADQEAARDAFRLKLARGCVAGVLLRHFGGNLAVEVSPDLLHKLPSVRYEKIAGVVVGVVFPMIHDKGMGLKESEQRKLLQKAIEASFREKASLRVENTCRNGEWRVRAIVHHAKPRLYDGRSDQRIKRMRAAQQARQAA